MKFSWIHLVKLQVLQLLKAAIVQSEAVGGSVKLYKKSFCALLLFLAGVDVVDVLSFCVGCYFSQVELLHTWSRAGSKCW